MLIQIEAFDPLFFRDGKPFSAGGDIWADGAGLPMPSVIYGALRATYAVHHAIPPEQIEEKTKNFRITDLYYSVRGHRYLLPAPLDLAVEEKPEKTYHGYYYYRRPISSKIITNFGFSEVIMPEKQSLKESLGFLIQETSFRNYLQGKKKNIYLKKIKEYLHEEPKIGIVYNMATHSVEEGFLYRVGTQRFEIKLSVEIEGLNDFPKKGLMKLGGEGKAARFDSISNFGSKIIPKEHSLKKGSVFKLYLASPAIFHQGAYPDLERFGFSCKLITAAIPKPVAIGGFDIQKNRPKPTYQVVPAGAVYYYRNDNDDPKLIIEKLHQKMISDVYSEQGFGLSFIANLPLESKK
ncbi:type III-B CRISPR module-associated Cmr3 family protein [Thioflexithrix psekupsensis]|uniref:Type III-B CRISPR module-associated protein Cmr3 n=1 Tax=Thioflexithrix psekupsensis TaxID=1570016 RepID=A0A251X8Z7_9GAMM|nr:type III-B CRISPR module-associated Cmr3 family protein [Thioflexithrix psekupsensis]OUD14539.1 hypothetical protein TPSD3_09610 [Thioflexithrix psekupsensis]